MAHPDSYGQKAGSKSPIRTLTVCEGRVTLGFIYEIRDRQFSAQLSATGETFGPFPTKEDAAQSINDGLKKIGGAQ
jgi:hypothetical protein